MSVTILVPSRGRPQRLYDMIDSARLTAEFPSQIWVEVRADEDDVELDEYRKVCEQLAGYFAPVRLLVGPRITAAKSSNELARRAPGEVFAVVADDVLFRTRGWDRMAFDMLRRFPDGLFVAAANAGDGRVRCNHWFTGRGWVNLFGGVMPEHFEHFCPDEWVEAVATACGRYLFLQGVLLEHMHKKLRNKDGARKAPDDEIYRSKRTSDAAGRSMSDRDIARWHELGAQRRADIDKLRAAVS